MQHISINQLVPTPNGEITKKVNLLLFPTNENRTREDWLSHLEFVNQSRIKSGLKPMEEWEANKYLEEREEKFEEFKRIRIKQEEDQKIKVQSEHLVWNFNLDIQNVEDHARLIIKQNPIYYDMDKKWWVWDKKQLYWKHTFEPEIINSIKLFFKAQGISSSSNRTTLLNALKDETQNNKPQQPKETWLQIGSKIYDISSNEVLTPEPKYFIKTIIPHEIGDTEETPYIDQLFKDWNPRIITGEDSFEVLQEITAYVMSPVQFLDSFYFLQGRGSDGKSVFLKLLTIMLGDIDDEQNKHKNTYHGSIEILTDTKQRFETYKLRNKLLAVLGDGNFGILSNSKMLKEASGNTDKIRGEMKGVADEKDFYSKAKIMCAFNTLPETKDKTKGFYRRIHLTFWEQEFTGEVNIIREIQNKHYHEINNLLKKNLRILREMYKKNKIKGMYGASKWQLTKEVYEQNANPLKLFMKSQMQNEIKGVFSKTQLFNEYRSWAEDNGFNSFEFKEVEQRISSMNLDYMYTWVYQMPDGFLFRNREKAFEYWRFLMLKTTNEEEKYFDTDLFEREINYERLKVFRGYTFNKQKVGVFK